MYNEEQLYKKVDGHISKEELGLLKSLVDDVNEFNKKYASRFADVYIDFDNVGTDGEFDPYETFQIKFDAVNSKDLAYTPVIHSELSIHQLDDCLCAIEQYFEELDDIKSPINTSLCDDNKSLLKRYYELLKDGRILYRDIEGYKTAKIEDITDQNIDGLLYDINRLPETIITLKDSDREKWSQAWVNDLALINVLKYYHKKCADLESKLRISEDKNLVNSIIKG